MRPTPDADENEIIARAKKGEMSAYETLVRTYQRAVYALCARITGAHQAADDLSQDTFLKAYLSLPHFIDGHPFFPWIRRIALNGCFNYLRQRNREAPLAEEETLARPNWLSSPHESPPEAAERDELETKFKEALRALPAEQKIIFSLRTFESLSYEEIARALHVPLGTVMSRLNRARKKLRHDLADYLRRGS